MAIKELLRVLRPETRAPEGTYNLLRSIEGGMLGSPYTFRKVEVTPAEEGSPNLDISVRLQLKPQLLYAFRIGPDERVRNLAATERWLYPRRDTILPPPEFTDVLGEIQTAIHNSPTPRKIAAAV